jgi:hypothetical protein
MCATQQVLSSVPRCPPYSSQQEQSSSQKKERAGFPKMFYSPDSFSKNVFVFSFLPIRSRFHSGGVLVLLCIFREVREEEEVEKKKVPNNINIHSNLNSSIILQLPS